MYAYQVSHLTFPPTSLPAHMLGCNQHTHNTGKHINTRLDEKEIEYCLKAL